MMMIVAVRAKPDIDKLPEQAQKALRKNGNFVYPDGEIKMLGTRTRANKKLVFIDSSLTKEDLELYGNADEVDEEGEVVSVDLGLEVLAVEGEPVDQSLLLPYFDNELVYNEATEEYDEVPITDLTGKLQIWAGREWLYS